MNRKQLRVTYAPATCIENKSSDSTEEDEPEQEDNYSHSQPTSSEFYVTPRERLLQFLRSPQTPFKASGQASQSTASRKPSFFDLHLHPNLQLRNIVVVEDLPELISSVCDEWLSTHLLFNSTKNNFPFEEESTSQSELSGKESNKKNIRNELGLSSSYMHSFGVPLAVISSCLIFKLTDWHNIFQFQLLPREKHAQKKFATPDGFLCVTREDEGEHARALQYLRKADQEDIQIITKHNFHHIVLWEFKSLFAGSKDTLDKIVNLEGSFTWPVCNRKTMNACHDTRHDQDGVFTLTGRKVGFDARDVDIINKIYATKATHRSADVPTQAEAINTTTVSSSRPDVTQGTGAVRQLVEATSSITGSEKAEARQSNLAEARLDQQHSNNSTTVYDPVPMQIYQEEDSDSSDLVMDDEGDDDNEASDKEDVHPEPSENESMDIEWNTRSSWWNPDVVISGQDPEEPNSLGTTIATSMNTSSKAAPKKAAAKQTRKSTSKSTGTTTASAKKPFKTIKKKVPKATGKTPPKPSDIIVQIWSAMIKFDATFLVLNAGNYELICVRCRATNTLYISRVFKIDDPIYRKTQISLHGLAFYDARDRAHQAEALESASDPTFPPSYYLPIQFDPYPPVHPAAAMLSVVLDKKLTIDDLMNDLERNDTFNVLLPKFLSRQTPSNKEPYTQCKLNHYMSTTTSALSVTGNAMQSKWILELAEKITEKVYSVVAKNEHASFSDKLVAKIAQNQYEYNNLTYEFGIHRQVESTSFGIKVFGILEVPDSRIRLMLMQHSGISHDDLRKKKKVMFARQHKNLYTEAMKALHDQRLLHGNPKGGHFLISEVEGGARVSLVGYKYTSFNHAMEVGGKKGDRVHREDEEFDEKRKEEMSFVERLE